MGKWINPWALLTITIAFLYYFYISLTSIQTQKSQPSKGKYGLFIAIISIGLMLFSFRSGLVEFPDPSVMSDVIPQINFQATRWLEHQNPYVRVPEIAHHPFPVYMPLNWLPFMFSVSQQLDSRIWSLILLGLLGILSFIRLRKQISIDGLYLIITLISIACLFYFHFARFDMMCTLETLILAYYFVLALGLVFKDKWLIVIGIICCILSRYTFVFWLPLLAFALLQLKQTKFLISIIVLTAAAIYFIYVQPFLLPHPDILEAGLRHHQHAAVDEWVGYENGMSWTMEKGVYFAAYFKKFLHGSMENKLVYMRYIQAAGLILSLLIALFRWKNRKLQAYDFLLFYLYIFIAEFFLFGALTYLYYYLSLSGIGAVMILRTFQNPNTLQVGSTDN